MPEPLALLPPGGPRVWTVTVDDSEPSSGTWENSYGGSPTLLRGLGPGTYRFGIGGWFETEKGAAGPREGYFTRFELTGEGIELRPDPFVTTTRHDGTVKVETTDENMAVEVVAEPVPDYDGVVGTIITEEAYRYSGLRNTLPFFGREAVERVVLSAGESMTLVPNGMPYLEYDGTTYRIRVVNLE